MVAGCGIRMCGNVWHPPSRGEGGYNKSCHTGSGDSIAKSAYNKNLLHQSVAPAHHRWSTSNARRGSDSLIGTQSSWPPLFGYRKNAKKEKWALVFHRSLLFRPNFPKTRAVIGDHTRKWKICFFSILGGVFFLYLFFAYFSSFFT